MPLLLRFPHHHVKCARFLVIVEPHTGLPSNRNSGPALASMQKKVTLLPESISWILRLASVALGTAPRHPINAARHTAAASHLHLHLLPAMHSSRRIVMSTQNTSCISASGTKAGPPDWRRRRSRTGFPRRPDGRCSAWRCPGCHNSRWNVSSFRFQPMVQVVFEGPRRMTMPQSTHLARITCTLAGVFFIRLPERKRGSTATHCWPRPPMQPTCASCRLSRARAKEQRCLRRDHPNGDLFRLR